MRTTTTTGINKQIVRETNGKFKQIRSVLEINQYIGETNDQLQIIVPNKRTQIKKIVDP